MSDVKSLQGVSLPVLTPKVLVLLSQFAKVCRRNHGVYIKLNKKGVFEEVHAINMEKSDRALHKIYTALVDEVNLLGGDDIVQNMSEFIALNRQLNPRESRR